MGYIKPFKKRSNEKGVDTQESIEIKGLEEEQLKQEKI